MTLDQALENIYTALHNDNLEIDQHIVALKTAMAETGTKEAVFTPSRLPHNNRQGRKMMQSYFKKRGVSVVFEEQ